MRVIVLSPIFFFELSQLCIINQSYTETLYVASKITIKGAKTYKGTGKVVNFLIY